MFLNFFPDSVCTSEGLQIDFRWSLPLRLGRSLFLPVVASLVGVELAVISRAAPVRASGSQGGLVSPLRSQGLLRSFTSSVMPEAQLLRCFQRLRIPQMVP